MAGRLPHPLRRGFSATSNQVLSLQAPPWDYPSKPARNSSWPNTQLSRTSGREHVGAGLCSLHCFHIYYWVQPRNHGDNLPRAVVESPSLAIFKIKSGCFTKKSALVQTGIIWGKVPDLGYMQEVTADDYNGLRIYEPRSCAQFSKRLVDSYQATTGTLSPSHLKGMWL